MTLKKPFFRHLGTTFTEWWLQPPSVGLCVTKSFHDQITCVQFHEYSYFARFLPTLGEESTCVESTSNKSFPLAPTTNLGHKSGNVLHVQSFGQLENCCERCGSMGWFASDFPTFLFHVNAATTFPERCLLSGFTYIYFFSASALTLGSPTGVGADLT